MPSQGLAHGVKDGLLEPLRPAQTGGKSAIETVANLRSAG